MGNNGCNVKDDAKGTELSSFNNSMCGELNYSGTLKFENLLFPNFIIHSPTRTRSMLVTLPHHAQYGV